MSDKHGPRDSKETRTEIAGSSWASFDFVTSLTRHHMSTTTAATVPTPIPTPAPAPAPAATTADKNKPVISVKVNLSGHAPIEEFRKFRDAMKHPASRMDMDVSAIGIEEAQSQNNQVTSLCKEVLTTITDFQSAMEELTIWKNEFLKQNIPSGIKLSLVLLFSRLFRRFVGRVQLVLCLLSSYPQLSSISTPPFASPKQQQYHDGTSLPADSYR